MNRDYGDCKSVWKPTNRENIQKWMRKSYKITVNEEDGEEEKNPMYKESKVMFEGEEEEGEKKTRKKRRRKKFHQKLSPAVSAGAGSATGLAASRSTAEETHPHKQRETQRWKKTVAARPAIGWGGYKKNPLPNSTGESRAPASAFDGKPRPCYSA